jgi:hypothetical protein
VTKTRTLRRTSQSSLVGLVASANTQAVTRQNSRSIVIPHCNGVATAAAAAGATELFPNTAGASGSGVSRATSLRPCKTCTGWPSRHCIVEPTRSLFRRAQSCQVCRKGPSSVRFCRSLQYGGDLAGDLLTTIDVTGYRQMVSTDKVHLVSATVKHVWLYVHPLW